MDTSKRSILTIGHSTRAIDEFIDLLKENGVTTLVDIRTVPRSRYNPQFNQEVLQGKLEQAGIGYLHTAGLGGLRHPVSDSVNDAWRNSSFRGFADYMQTREFEENLKKLIILAGKERTVIMCAESLPWRCHRSLIADALLVHGLVVGHVMGKGKLTTHDMTRFARVDGKMITYLAHPLIDRTTKDNINPG